MITKYNDYCIICGRPRDDMHQCLKGVKQRHLADEDELIIPVSREHHEAIHKRKELNVLVEIIAQLAWERDQLISNQELPFDDLSGRVREDFRTRYGRSYL